MSFTPAFMLSLGSGKELVSHMNKYSATNISSTNRRKLRGSLNDGQSNVQKFGVQSIGANFDLMYTIGKFTIEPQLYLDYYLQTTTTSRLTDIYNIVFAIDF